MGTFFWVILLTGRHKTQVKCSSLHGTFFAMAEQVLAPDLFVNLSKGSCDTS